MPRAKKKPSIEQQLRTLIATATEEKDYKLAKELVGILEKRAVEGPIGPGQTVRVDVPGGENEKA